MKSLYATLVVGLCAFVNQAHAGYWEPSTPWGDPTALQMTCPQAATTAVSSSHVTQAPSFNCQRTWIWHSTHVFPDPPQPSVAPNVTFTYNTSGGTLSADALTGSNAKAKTSFFSQLSGLHGGFNQKSIPSYEAHSTGPLATTSVPTVGQTHNWGYQNLNGATTIRVTATFTIVNSATVTTPAQESATAPQSQATGTGLTAPLP